MIGSLAVSRKNSNPLLTGHAQKRLRRLNEIRHTWVGDLPNGSRRTARLLA